MSIVLALRACLAIALGLLALTLVATALHGLWLARVAGPPAPADVIVVLGGDMTEASTLARETARRVEKGVELFRAGAAPRIHFTGGVPQKGQPGAGDQMRAYAATLGAPAAASSAENHSRSTLQNALMSEPVLGPLAQGSVILVSDGYHLARSWTGFRWAGYNGRIQLSAATAFGERSPPDQALRLLREATAWWFNLARIAAWEILTLAGAPDDLRMNILR